MAKRGRPTTYNPLYCQQIIDFFSPPHYLLKDITITKSDGTQIDKTVMEALPPVFLSDFARSINVSIIHYSQIFKQWASRNLDFNEALKRAKELEMERIRVNATMGLYPGAFSIFTMKNIAGWRDDKLMIDQSQHTHFNFEYKTVNENNIRTSQSADGGMEESGKMEGLGGRPEVRKDLIGGSRVDEESPKETES